jgi:hypothetical protein
MSRRFTNTVSYMITTPDAHSKLWHRLDESSLNDRNTVFMMSEVASNAIRICVLIDSSHCEVVTQPSRYNANIAANTDIHEL